MKEDPDGHQNVAFVFGLNRIFGIYCPVMVSIPVSIHWSITAAAPGIECYKISSAASILLL